MPNPEMWKSESESLIPDDAWVSVEGQRTFVRALVARGIPQELIEFHAFPQTGAPAEHIGFGRYASQAKDLGAAFLERQLRRSL